MSPAENCHRKTMYFEIVSCSRISCHLHNSYDIRPRVGNVGFQAAKNRFTSCLLKRHVRSAGEACWEKPDELSLKDFLIVSLRCGARSRRICDLPLVQQRGPALTRLVGPDDLPISYFPTLRRI